MAATPSSSEEAARAIGALCIEGDWACVHGDLDGLGRIARELAERVAEPLHCELVALAALCRRRSDRAVATWTGLRERSFQDGDAPG